MVRSVRRVLPGRPLPLGASLQPSGVNFAIVSQHADRVQLCLFDLLDQAETERIDVLNRSGHVWHCFVPGLTAGQLYGYRVHGAYDPARGLRFNPAKLLVDPYARALAGRNDWRYPLQGYGARDDEPDTRDDSPGVQKCVVVADDFDWSGDSQLEVPWTETLIYETHVKGFTFRHPDVPPALRGTYAGLASPAAVRHLKDLGVTAVELLPVHAHADRSAIIERGLTNYWGYDSIGFFAPDARFSSSDPSGRGGGQVREFKEMVRELHRNGIEVILDVVYNHTTEGNHRGATLSFRGVDNSIYYRLEREDPARYVNYTGTGNTVNARHPQVLRLIMDSLRYWVQEMHVDGFRFDLAPALAREDTEVDPFSSFLDAVHQDPNVSRVKLIAEPWDLGHNGYQAGNFPPPWAEWNDRFRDAVRHYWRGDESKTPELAYRLSGSSDLYSDSRRDTYASINFVTAHDGFTLHDLVSYTTKRNEANGEQNRDGRDSNISWNGGIEGATNNARVLASRQQQKRNFLATLLFSQGVPMLLGGDELGRTQLGNNNAYCQDNEISWYDWSLDDSARELLNFTQRLVAIRRAHPGLRRKSFLHGRAIRGSGIKDITWLRQDGNEMTDADWDAPWLKCFGLRLDGHLGEFDEEGNAVIDDVLLLLLNASDIDLDFTLPDSHWTLEVDTGRPKIADGTETYTGHERFKIGARSLALLRHPLRTPLSRQT